MGTSYKHDRLSGNFINLTNETIHIYEYCTGQIWVFEPSDEPLPKSPHFDSDIPLTHYIVEPEVAERLKESGRSLEDIAIVSEKLSGRNGTEIVYLRWGKKPSINVRLYQGFKKEPKTTIETLLSSGAI